MDRDERDNGRTEDHTDFSGGNIISDYKLSALANPSLPLLSVYTASTLRLLNIGTLGFSVFGLPT